ncbi:MAG: hypothetical protein IJS13_08135 [Paludibacteraceae bacterium]|nr:hypothetical protein [Paludibacteraceae bacterium]
MAESTYESKITSSPSPVAAIYAALGNLRNIERVSDLIPQDKVTDMEVSDEQIRFKVDGLGQKISVSLVDRKENNMLKYCIDASVVQANFWIQMKEVGPGDTRLKLTMKSDIPVMFRMMLEQKIKEGLNQAADMLAAMPFENWRND